LIRINFASSLIAKWYELPIFFPLPRINNEHSFACKTKVGLAASVDRSTTSDPKFRVWNAQDLW
jgi:hypothetical protein